MTTDKPTNRKLLKTVGQYGATVRAFTMTLDGDTVARVEWRENGQRKTQTFRGPKRDREESAKAFADGVHDRLKGGQVVAPKRSTVGDLWAAYVTAHAPDWRPKTLAIARARWAVFTLHVAPLTFADLVQPETLDKWREVLLGTSREKTGKPMARNQVAHHIQLIKSVWKFARARRLLAENVLADYAVKKGRDYGALEVPEYTGDEWGRILAALSFRDARQWRAWAAIALDGLLAPRSNALLNLRWSDVDLARRVVRWRGEHDKVGKLRTQPLPRDAVRVLRICRVWARRQAYAGDFVFYGVQERTRGTHWTYSALNRQLHEAATRAGVDRIKYRAMHSLRRMSAGNVLELTGDITRVGDWLGDSDVRVLRRSYLRHRPDGLADVVAGTVLPRSTRAPADKTSNETATAPKVGAAEETVNR